MKKGGYQIIDFSGVKGINSSSKVTVSGIYDKISNTKKALLISGFTVNDVSIRDYFATAIKYDSNTYHISIFPTALQEGFDFAYMIVTSDDGVSVVDK